MAATFIRVRQRYLQPDGDPPDECPDPEENCGGRVTFQLSTPLADAAGNVIFENRPITRRLGADGLIDLELVATDDPQLAPNVGVFYVVTERIIGAPIRQYKIEVAMDSPLGEMWLSDVAPALPGPQVFTYALDSRLTQHVNSAHGGFISPPGWLDIKHPTYGGTAAIGNNVADDTQAINDLIDYLNIAGGIGDLGFGFYKHLGDLHQLTHPGASLRGNGPELCKILPVGNVKSLDLTIDPFDVRTHGYLEGIEVDGMASGADSIGLHTCDDVGRRISNFRVRNFTGVNAYGIIRENVNKWTERNVVNDRVWLDNNRVGIVFDGGTSPSKSFGHNRFDVDLNVNGGQTGIVLRNSVFMYGGTFSVTANLIGDHPVMCHVQDHSQMADMTFEIDAEGNTEPEAHTNYAVGFHLDRDATVFGSGTPRMDNMINIIEGDPIITCTSSTRPGSPVAGQQIYETDTGDAYEWDPPGGDWDLVTESIGPASHLARFRIMHNSAYTGTPGNLNVLDGGKRTDIFGTGRVVPMLMDQVLGASGMFGFVIGDNLVTALVACFQGGGGIQFGALPFDGAPNEYVDLGKILTNGAWLPAGPLVMPEDGGVFLSPLGTAPAVGQATLVPAGGGSSVTIPHTGVGFGSFIFPTVALAGGTQGDLSVRNIIEAESFEIHSSSPTETSVVRWLMINPTP